MPPRSYSWKWTDPYTNKEHQTRTTLPGLVWDTIFKKVFHAKGLDPLDSSFILTSSSDHPKRSKCHLRACTNDEKKTYTQKYVPDASALAPDEIGDKGDQKGEPVKAKKKKKKKKKRVTTTGTKTLSQNTLSKHTF